MDYKEYHKSITVATADLRAICIYEELPNIRTGRRIISTFLAEGVSLGLLGFPEVVEQFNSDDNISSYCYAVAEMLKKQSFVKRLIVYKTSTLGGLDKTKEVIVGYKIDRKRFRRWFKQNRNRFPKPLNN